MHRENLESIRNRNIELVRYKIDNRIREHLDGIMKVEEISGKWVGTI